MGLTKVLNVKSVPVRDGQGHRFLQSITLRS